MVPTFLGLPLWPTDGPTLIQIALLIVVSLQLVAAVVSRRRRNG